MYQPKQGFTLLEILVALFIFAILSIMMIGAFQSVLKTNSSIENNTQAFRQLQFAMLIMSRDIEQAVARPIIDTFGREAPAFIGSHDNFIFTHMGTINDVQGVVKNTLQRTQYQIVGGNLVRRIWPVLDMAPTTLPQNQLLLKKIADAHFEYLSEDNKFYTKWPIPEEPSLMLPLAVRLFIFIAPWGNMSQLYVLPTQPIKKKD